MRRLSVFYDVPGYLYEPGEGSLADTSGNGTQARFIEGSVAPIADQDFGAILLVFRDFGATEIAEAFDSVLSGGAFSLISNVDECFSCSPFRTGGYGLITAGEDDTAGGVVPLPASGLLLLGALGLVALRRKAAA